MPRIIPTMPSPATGTVIRVNGVSDETIGLLMRPLAYDGMTRLDDRRSLDRGNKSAGRRQ